MLLLNPRQVSFADVIFPDIAAIAIDRAAHRAAEHWSDLGPYAVFADVPEQTVRITITQELARGDVHAPRPGDAGTLTFHASPTASDAARRRYSCAAVILDIRHDLSLRRGAVRTITLAAVSPDGATDPITAADAST